MSSETPVETDSSTAPSTDADHDTDADDTGDEQTDAQRRNEARKARRQAQSDGENVAEAKPDGEKTDREKMRERSKRRQEEQKANLPDKPPRKKRVHFYRETTTDDGKPIQEISQTVDFDKLSKPRTAALQKHLMPDRINIEALEEDDDVDFEEGDLEDIEDTSQVLDMFKNADGSIPISLMMLDYEGTEFAIECIYKAGEPVEPSLAASEWERFVNEEIGTRMLYEVANGLFEFSNQSAVTAVEFE